MFRPKIIAGYTLRRIIKPFMLSISVGMLFLIVARLAIVLNLTLGKPGGVDLVFRMLLFWLPHYLSLCIPVSVFLGIMIGFKQMVEDSEINAIQASGVGLHQIFLPIFLLSIILSILSISLFGWIEPYAKYSWKKGMYLIEHHNVFIFIETGTFMKINNKTIIFDNLYRNKKSFSRFFMYEDRSKNGFTTTTAGSGRLLSPKNSDLFYLELNDVVSLQTDRAANPDKDLTLPRGRLVRTRTVVRPITDEVKAYRPRGVNETEWTATEIVNAMLSGSSDIEFKLVRAEFNYRLAKSVFLLILPFFCFPFTIKTGKKTGIITIGMPVIVIIVLYILLDHAKTLIKEGWPALGIMWIPIGCFALLIAFRYWRVCFTVPKAP